MIGQDRTKNIFWWWIKLKNGKTGTHDFHFKWDIRQIYLADLAQQGAAQQTLSQLSEYVSTHVSKHCYQSKTVKGKTKLQQQKQYDALI